MIDYNIGDIVLIPFPYTNLFEYKKRPAFVLKVTQEDLILLAVTSNGFSDTETVNIFQKDLESGFLPKDSYVKIEKIITLHNTLVIKKLATLKKYKIKEITQKFISLF